MTKVNPSLIKEENAVEQEIILPGVKRSGIFVKRFDLVHLEISGNKWFKLKYNLIRAEEKGYNTLLTFGGAYSNHIYSTAAAGKLFGFKTIGIIRGEEHSPLNPTLSFAKECGMELHYLNRSMYRYKAEEAFQDHLKKIFGDIYIIPEGGTNELAVKGTSEIVSSFDNNYDLICAPVGTGGTSAGIIAGLNGNKNYLGFAVLKSADFLLKDVYNLLIKFNGRTYSNWNINLDYHFGGYAKINYDLISFINEFENLNNIKLDPVYTGKMMFGVWDLIRKNKLNFDKILILHTGGLQGVEGMQPKISSLLNSKTGETK